MDQVTIADLRKYMLDEVTRAFGFPKKGIVRSLIGGLFYFPADRSAKIAVNIDQIVAQQGVQVACRNLLSQFTEGLEVHGIENIPVSGPLLIACNHPGAADSLAVVANVPRDDIKVVVSGVPILESLPSVAPYLIFAPAGAHQRMNTARKMIRHLGDQGALVVFATGRVDPDPDILPGAEKALEEWSASLEIVMRRVPETRLLPTIISGVLSPIALQVPFIRLQKEAWKQRRLAEYFQLVGQLFFPGRFRISPRVTFGRPLTRAELLSTTSSISFMEAVIENAKNLLKIHQDTIGKSKIIG